MIRRLLPSLLALIIPRAAFAASDDAGVALSGTYVLSQCPNNIQTFDRIVFKNDWTCLIDPGDGRSVPGKYQLTGAGDSATMTIDPSSAMPPATYGIWRLDHSFWLTPASGGEPIGYSLLPPHPPNLNFDQIVGTFFCRERAGYNAFQITPDHKFHSRAIALDSDAHTAQEIDVDGTVTYANGIITYFNKHSTPSVAGKFNRDVIIRRDNAGIWVVDTFENTLLCEIPANSLDLPPPPPGYSQIPK